jgi:protein-S-isoprenylcysteine O-methyltransferase Ste14
METASDSGPGAPLPPTLIYVAGFALGWWLERAMPLVSGGTAVSGGVSALGWGLAAIGTVLFIWGLATFARLRTGIMLQRAATQVVAAGPYRWSRNPMYVAFTMMYIGVALALSLLWPLILLPVVIAVLTVAVIAREERYMRATFGAHYADYCSRVRRWL